MLGRGREIIQRLGVFLHALDGNTAVVRLLSAIRSKRRIVKTDKAYPGCKAALDPRNAVMQPSQRLYLPADSALPDHDIVFLLRWSTKRALPLFTNGRQTVERLRLGPVERDDELRPLIRLPERRKECILRLPFGLPALKKRSVGSDERIGEPLQKGKVHFAALFKRLDCSLSRNEHLRVLVPFHPEEIFFTVIDGLRRDPRYGITEGKEFVSSDSFDLLSDDHLPRIGQDIGDPAVRIQNEIPTDIVNNRISVRRKITLRTPAKKIVIFTKSPQHMSSFAYIPTSITPSRIFGR